VIDRSGNDLNAVIEQVKNADRDIAVVVDKDQKFEGMVSAESLAKARQGDGKLGSAFLSDVKPVQANEGLSDVLHKVAHSAHPVPVVDENGRYVGSVSKTALLQTLDRAG
jgi:glycine betaine/proline transport system ATP-binding protein